jgi:hypothetical protein
MKYKVIQTSEAENDIFQLADYMVSTLKNKRVAPLSYLIPAKQIPRIHLLYHVLQLLR